MRWVEEGAAPVAALRALYVSGGKLWAMIKDGKVVLKDEKGNWSTVTQADVFQSNGVIHVVDTVVMPN